MVAFSTVGSWKANVARAVFRAERLPEKVMVPVPLPVAPDMPRIPCKVEEAEKFWVSAG